MKEEKYKSVLNYNWSYVISNFWKRYPNNPFSKHVLSEDIISTKIDSDGRLHTRRILSKTNKLPTPIQSILRIKNTGFVIEDVVVDKNSKALTSTTYNIDCTKLMTVKEIIKYTPLENAKTNELSKKIKNTVEKTQTLLNYTVQFDCPFYFTSSYIIMLAKKRYKNNMEKAINGWNHILARNKQKKMLK
ncbi:PRELI domain-containing protein 1, mitochondrial [Intoshia linei]|uniref:PRELI domain-containing protein 1, mitochondrial n=1 Tax=Intoshia linei TaxID=1819745 RepID=A0A177BCX5_9BILA|nr:PRELI domain-containing protein 1, mitochondrial [Intoshia linei]